MPEYKTVEYGLTHQVELSDGTSMWVKYGATAELTDYEDPTIASKQLAQHVHRAMEARIAEAVEHATKLGANVG